MRTGWICPRCSKSNSPDMQTCSCSAFVHPDIPKIQPMLPEPFVPSPSDPIPLPEPLPWTPPWFDVPFTVAGPFTDTSKLTITNGIDFATPTETTLDYTGDKIH